MNNVNDAMKQVEEMKKMVNTINSTSDAIVWNEIPSGVVDGSNASFVLQHTPELNGKVLIFVNGVLQERHDSSADYNLAGKTITFTSPPRRDSKILVTYAKAT